MKQIKLFLFFLTLSILISSTLEHGESNEGSDQSEAQTLVNNMKKGSSALYNEETDKALKITAPYNDNEDYLITGIGIGEPVNFYPVQVDTTTYKSWVPSNEIEDQKISIFYYSPSSSSTSAPTDEYQEIVDEQGTVYGEVVKDTFHINKYEIKNLPFIRATKFYDDFTDYFNGKLGLGFSEYASENEKSFSILERLKESGYINKRLYSFREVSDSLGEVILGDIPEEVKENDFPLLDVINKEKYESLSDEEFQMSWITTVTHVLFKTMKDENSTALFKSGMRTPDGLAAFDSACSYIVAPYDYINEFEEKMFDKFYENICHKVNQGGVVKFLCNPEKYNANLEKTKDLSLVLVMDGYGFDIPMDLLFEQTSDEFVEFFVEFKQYSQNVWNLGHPFFHNYIIVFDQENKMIGVSGKGITPMEEIPEIEAIVEGTNIWKWIIFILLGLLALIGIFLFMRWIGMEIRRRKGIDPSLIDNESISDWDFDPGRNLN